jgi:hypothetical protein
MPDDESTETTTTPPPAAPVDPPQWASELATAIRELPGKLRATLTDDDRSQIAEAVHGLFERSGAFEAHHEAETTEETTETEAETVTTEETEPRKSGLSGFASWFDGGK